MDGAFVNKRGWACKEKFAPADPADGDFWPRPPRLDKKKEAKKQPNCKTSGNTLSIVLKCDAAIGPRR